MERLGHLFLAAPAAQAEETSDAEMAAPDGSRQTSAQQPDQEPMPTTPPEPAALPAQPAATTIPAQPAAPTAPHPWPAPPTPEDFSNNIRASRLKLDRAEPSIFTRPGGV